MPLDRAHIQKLLDAFLSVAQLSGIEKLQDKIVAEFFGAYRPIPSQASQIERQLRRWAETNPSGTYAVAIRPARELYVALFGASSPGLFDVPDRSATAEAPPHRPLTALQRSGRLQSVAQRAELLAELMDADLGALFQAEHAAAPRRHERKKLYLRARTGITSSGDHTNRHEEHLAVALFSRFGASTEGLNVGGDARIRLLDYQVPLKARDSDSLGKVDLLGVDHDSSLCVVELKSGTSNEALLRGLIEGLSYAAILHANVDDLGNECRNRGVMTGTSAPSVQVWAPERFWSKREHEVARVKPFQDRVTDQTGVRITLHSLGDVSVVPGLNGERPTLVGEPIGRRVG